MARQDGVRIRCGRLPSSVGFVGGCLVEKVMAAKELRTPLWHASTWLTEYADSDKYNILLHQQVNLLTFSVPYILKMSTPKLVRVLGYGA